MGTASSTCAISALLLSLCFVAQAQLGFVSLDCGKPANYSSTDTRGISYSSDSSYIDTGENHQISISIATATLDPKLKDLRSFPEGKRNCYTILPVTKGKRYLVRAYFLYGNYDGLDTAPQFDLYLETNLWSKVSISNASTPEVHEIIAEAAGNSMQVCLVETGFGKPFLSALELRPFINHESYPANASHSLITVAMINFGGQSEIRYPKDNYDRIWKPYLPLDSTTLSSPSRIENDECYVPSEVMQTAATPITGSTLNFSWPVDESRGPLYYHMIKHFAELNSLAANESRIINYAENGVLRIPKYKPNYLVADSWWSSEPQLYSKLEFSLSEAPGSSLPPIINAMEIFQVRYPEENFTDITDVEAMLMIKAAYRLRRNWMGDPCAPKDFLWDGLQCDYNVKPYRIIHLNLSSSGLVGTLATSLGDLSELQYLDLSFNNLSGDIPTFFATLSNIKFLNIKCSGLNGSIPEALQAKAAAKTLTLVTGPCLPPPDLQPNPHPRKNQAVKIAVAVVGSVLFLLVVAGLIIWWKRYHNTGDRRNDIPRPPEPNIIVSVSPYQSECRLFQYKELVRMTKNFTQLLGKGGSCSVFLGYLNNGTPVAVKKLSISDSSSRQFKDEVEVLKTIKHENLITLIGYCEDKKHLALVYEYMPRGSLADQLSDKKDGRETLGWRDRMRIAFEAAQGLEYLHYGCRKPVIHRDIKTTNILLTANTGARIADFGISKTSPTQGQAQQFTRIVGTPGYVDPEYVSTGTPTTKSDVYSFGVILLELISGLPAIISQENCTLVSWVEKHSQTANLDEMVDRRLKGYNKDSIQTVMELAVACTRLVSLHRPTMSEVVAQLKDCLGTEDMHRGSGLSSRNSSIKNECTSSEVFPVPTVEGVAGCPSPR